MYQQEAVYLENIMADTIRDTQTDKRISTENQNNFSRNFE